MLPLPSQLLPPAFAAAAASSVFIFERSRAVAMTRAAPEAARVLASSKPIPPAEQPVIKTTGRGEDISLGRGRVFFVFERFFRSFFQKSNVVPVSLPHASFTSPPFRRSDGKIKGPLAFARRMISIEEARPRHGSIEREKSEAIDSRFCLTLSLSLSWIFFLFSLLRNSSSTYK